MQSGISQHNKDKEIPTSGGFMESSDRAAGNDQAVSQQGEFTRRVVQRLYVLLAILVGVFTLITYVLTAATLDDTFNGIYPGVARANDGLSVIVTVLIVMVGAYFALLFFPYERVKGGHVVAKMFWWNMLFIMGPAVFLIVMPYVGH
jgi:magnesium-transporting ATPase (P-type)